ncbi:MAG: 3-phosphoshikimate 1-carboxyvinyltransferase, partial [Thermoanaerobaculia bacterium]
MSAPRPLPRGRLAGSLRIPGSKSLTNRALVAAALAEGESELLNPLDSTDTRALAAALRLLGAEILLEGVRWRVRGPLRPRGDAAPELTIDVGDAGTPARFLAALLAAVPGRYILDGSARMRERPMSPLFEAIRSLGGDVTCLAREGYLPA